MPFLGASLGIRLVLSMGKTIPLPAPQDALQAFTRIEVNNDQDTGDGFQITFVLTRDMAGSFSLISGGYIDPGTRVIIGVAIGIEPQVLIDGIVTQHQFTPSNDPGQSTLTITGKDLTQALDLEEKNATYPNQPDFLIFTQIIASYAQYGLVPVPTPTTDIPIVTERVPKQQETDLRFIQRMAQRNGFVFYIEPVTFGVNQAYFGPVIRAGIPQPALTIAMGAATNLKSISFGQDSLATVGVSGTFQEPITKLSIPIPSLPSLKIPPLAASPSQPLRKTILRETANMNPGQAATRLVAAATNAPDSVTAQGQVDTARYGSVLRARKLVGVRGVGLTYDGFYTVRKVKHVITRDDYTQEFTISREGTGTLVPVVVP